MVKSTPVWNYLANPLMADNYRSDVEPFPNESGIQLLLSNNSTVLIGDWINIRSDEGCGCCSGGRNDVIIAWRDWRNYLKD